MALPARRDWPEDAEEALAKARRARDAKRAAVLLWDVLIVAGLAVAYLWALDCRSRALSRLERAIDKAAQLEKICREIRAEIAVLSSPASLKEAAERSGMRPPKEGEVDFLIVLPPPSSESKREGPRRTQPRRRNVGSEGREASP